MLSARNGGSQMEKNGRLIGKSDNILKDSLLHPAVFPGVATASRSSYVGDSETPIRGSKHPFPSLFPRRIDPRAKDYLNEVLNSGFTSAMISRFEEAFAKACGVSHAVAVANCTAACHTAIAVCDLNPGDEVIVSAITDYGSVMGVFV